MTVPNHPSSLRGLLSILMVVASSALLALPAQHALANDHAQVVQVLKTPGKVVIGAPSDRASPCDDDDFGAVQIRIGLHATLAACYRDVALDGRFGTAFVTVPREFEDRLLSNAEFDALREDVQRSEDQFKRQARNGSTSAAESVADTSPGLRPIPLGVFDNTDGRIGYAYAYSVNQREPNGDIRPQAMMRTESFLLVNGRVILLMIIAPVDDGQGASVAFNTSERWANAILAASTPLKQVSVSNVLTNQ